MKQFLTLLAFVITCLSWQAVLAETEPNNTIAEANNLPLGAMQSGTASTITGDIDFFKVVLVYDGKLRVDFTITNGVSCVVQLQHAAGGVVTSKVTAGADSLVSYTLAAGDYYVRFYPTTINATCNYTVTHFSQVYAEGENDAEPNNTPAEAQVFVLNSEETGHFGYFNQGSWDGTDWWKITTTEDGNLHIKLRSLWGAWMYATLFDSDGTTQLFGGGINTCCAYPDSMVVGGLAPGTYLLRISAQWVNTTSPYEIENYLHEPAEANDAEPNNSVEEATKLGLNKTKEGHIGYYGAGQGDWEDWYKISTKEGGMLHITIEPTGSHWLYADVFDKDGNTLLKKAWNYYAFDFKLDGLNASDYYIRLYTAGGGLNSVYNPYTLTNEFEAYQYADDEFSNDIAAKAATIPANGTVYGHIGFSGNLSADYTDWWKINYTGSGSLNIATDAEAQLATDWYNHYYAVTIYKDTLAAPIFNYSYLDWSNNNLTNLTPGYYWIRISYQTGFNSYSITNTFAETGIATINSFKAITGIDCNDHKLQAKCTGSQPPYTVQAYRFGEVYGDPVMVKDNTKFTIKNLPPGSYHLTARGDGASDAAVDTSNAKDLVPVPANVQINSITASSAKVTWDGLPDCIDKYEVKYRVQGSSNWTKVTVNGTKEKYTINGLQPATSYEWSLMAIVKNSTGELEALSQKVTGGFSTPAFGADGEKLEDELSLQPGIRVYPNPAADYCTITWTGNPDEQLNISIADAGGKVVSLKSQVTGGSIETEAIDLTRFSAGTYLITVKDEAGNGFTGKLIITK